jgi:hypothetical protein
LSYAKETTIFRRCKMRSLVRMFLVVALLLGAAAASHAIHETLPSETQIVLPGADAAKLYEYITRYDPYERWGLWPGKGKLYEGTEPHGALLTTYVNETALRAVKKGEGELPEGSIIAKENYTPEEEFVALTVMYKIKGYNPQGGDWFWAKYGPKGDVQAAGRAKGCLKCHGRVSDTDYLWSRKLK